MYFSLFTLALGFVFLSFCFSREIISCKYYNNIRTIVCKVQAIELSMFKIAAVTDTVCFKSDTMH